MKTDKILCLSLSRRHFTAG